MANENKKLTVALAGNPNIGKSTIFNVLTGANQHIGNYPGVTVEKKEGKKTYRGYEFNFVDLPGTYSLSAYSQDEVVARDFIIREKPDIVINVIDASNLERNLYLFTQLAELNIPIAVALNMMDILRAHGFDVDPQKLSKLLGVPVIPTVGTKKTGVSYILDVLIDNYESGVFANQSAAKVDYGDDIKTETLKLESLISKAGAFKDFPLGWLSIKLLDNDPLALRIVGDSNVGGKLLSQTQKSRKHITEHFGKNAEVEIAGRRYGFAKSVAKSVLQGTTEKKTDITEVIDKFVLNKYFGIPVFAVVMYIIFKFTFTLSGPVVNLFGKFFALLGSFVGSIIPAGPLQSLVVDGVIAGVGGVLSFFPLVLFMFFAIAFFEDSGYMARAAFVMDKIMSRFGLHGKSFLPLMISTNGCAVPAILAARTLDSKRDRFITMYVAPFMICGAKFPIFALIVGAFFAAKYQTNIMFVFYILSIVIALTAAKILSKTVLRGDPSHFVIELPPYHLPTLRGLLLKMWERGWLYVRKAGTIIVLLSILVWAAFTYPKTPANPSFTPEQNAAVQLSNSVAGQAGRFLEPAFKPIGMDGPRAVALLSGLAAKEVVISTLGTIYSLGKVNSESDQPLKQRIATDPSWSPLKGIVFLIFCLIYMPCIATVVVFFKETRSIKWLAMLVLGNTLIAWIVAFVVFQLGTLLRIGI